MTDSLHSARSADPGPDPAAELPEGAREVYAEAEAPDAGAAAEHHPPHPPGTRSPEDYTDPPGHHRRGEAGPALDVGA